VFAAGALDPAAGFVSKGKTGDRKEGEREKRKEMMGKGKQRSKGVKKVPEMNFWQRPWVCRF